MFGSLGLPGLLAVFLVAAGVIWVAGVWLSGATDVLSERLGLGEALGGLILLAIATNLPEIAITTSAAFSGDLGIATGNILGGIAIQTVVLAILDAGCRGPGGPLTTRSDSLILLIEGGVVVGVLAVVVMGAQLPPGLALGHTSPASTLVVAVWLVGLWLVSRARRGLPWQDRVRPRRKRMKQSERRLGSTSRAVLLFSLGAGLTLAAGVVVEQSGEGIAGEIGLSGAVFGATVLAAATSLPEISTGLASVKLGDYELAVSDIFGGNAFLPTLFFVATLISGKAVLPDAGKTDIYLTALAILLTLVFMTGLLFRPQKRIARLGIDSLIAIALYAVGILGLIAVTHG